MVFLLFFISIISFISNSNLFIDPNLRDLQGQTPLQQSRAVGMKVEEFLSKNGGSKPEGRQSPKIPPAQQEGYPTKKKEERRKRKEERKKKVKKTSYFSFMFHTNKSVTKFQILHTVPTTPRCQPLTIRTQCDGLARKDAKRGRTTRWRGPDGPR